MIAIDDSLGFVSSFRPVELNGPSVVLSDKFRSEDVSVEFRASNSAIFYMVGAWKNQNILFHRRTSP